MKVLCSLCPTAMDADDYPAHFDRLHSVNYITGEKQDFVPPRQPPKRERRIDPWDETLFFGRDLEFDQ